MYFLTCEQHLVEQRPSVFIELCRITCQRSQISSITPHTPHERMMVQCLKSDLTSDHSSQEVNQTDGAVSEIDGEVGVLVSCPLACQLADHVIDTSEQPNGNAASAVIS